MYGRILSSNCAQSAVSVQWGGRVRERLLLMLLQQPPPTYKRVRHPEQAYCKRRPPADRFTGPRTEGRTLKLLYEKLHKKTSWGCCSLWPLQTWPFVFALPMAHTLMTRTVENKRSASVEKMWFSATSGPIMALVPYLPKRKDPCSSNGHAARKFNYMSANCTVLCQVVVCDGHYESPPWQILSSTPSSLRADRAKRATAGWARVEDERLRADSSLLPHPLLPRESWSYLATTEEGNGKEEIVCSLSARAP